MRHHRFVINQDLNQATIEFVDVEVIHQMKDVLKLKTGEEVTLCDGKGNEAVGLIGGIDKERVVVKIIKNFKLKINNSLPVVVLYCAILKRDNFELVAQKATEIGVSEIVPVISHRTIKTGLRRDRLEKIIKEAVEQSGRCELPVLGETMELEKAIEDAKKKNEVNIFLDFCKQRLSPKDFRALGSFTGGQTPPSLPLERGGSHVIGIFVGPEGGWDEGERKLVEENGFLVRSLGEFVLRAETAAIVATYVATSF